MIDYKLVPVEPTEEMLAEGVTAALEGISWTTAAWIYEAMLAAAPAVQGECLGVGKCTDQGCPAHYAAAPAVQGEPEVAMLVAALEKARDAIASLPEDALGNVPDTQQCQGWYIRDELINDISTALTAYRNQGGES